MSMDDVYLTREGYEKLMHELQHLKTVKRREISKAIGAARELGDISENAEYDAAKENQAHNEKKIAELGDKLSRARIIEHENIPKDRALIGATLKLKDLDTEEELQYTLVSEVESDFEQNKISITSPVGKALLNHKKNDVVEINVPAGALKYKILDISR